MEKFVWKVIWYFTWSQRPTQNKFSWFAKYTLNPWAILLTKSSCSLIFVIVVLVMSRCSRLNVEYCDSGEFFWYDDPKELMNDLLYPFNNLACTCILQIKCKILLDTDIFISSRSHAEYLQRLLPTSAVVKAFNVLSAYVLESGGIQGSKEVKITNIKMIKYND